MGAKCGWPRFAATDGRDDLRLSDLGPRGSHAGGLPCTLHTSPSISEAGGKMASFAELTKDELVELYKWHSTGGIADKYGVSAETVRKRFLKLGISRRKQGGRRDFDPPAKDLTELYQSMSMAQIAEKYGVGETVVWKRLHEHGIELRDFKNHRLKQDVFFP